MVYGSTQAVTDNLRLPDGHMKTSAGGNLPIAADAPADGRRRAGGRESRA